MIRLPHGYYITSDAACYTLWRSGENISRRIKPRYRDAAVGQYVRLETALNAYADAVDRNVLENGNMDVSEALNVIRKTRKRTIMEIRQIIGKMSIMDEVTI